MAECTNELKQFKNKKLGYSFSIEFHQFFWNTIYQFMCQKKESILNLKLSSEPVYTLGLYYSYNEKHAPKNILWKVA